MIVHSHDQSGDPKRPSDTEPLTQLIDWFAEGQALAVEIGGTVVTIRYLTRNARRARIAITGPAGAVFRTLDTSEDAWSRNRPT